jgi:hypothetical protein
MFETKKAKSRLSKNAFVPRRLSGQNVGDKARAIVVVVAKKIWQVLKLAAKIAWQWLKNYYHYLQVLTVSLFFFAIVFLIVTRISPSSIANIPLPDTYLLLQIPLFLGNFFFGTFLFQNKKLGLLFAVAIAVILFFKFQHFLI